MSFIYKLILMRVQSLFSNVIKSASKSSSKRTFSKCTPSTKSAYANKWSSTKNHNLTNFGNSAHNKHPNAVHLPKSPISEYEKMCTGLARMVRFGNISLPSIPDEITIESLRRKGSLDSKDIEHLVLLKKEQSTTLKDLDLALGPKDAPMMDLVSKSGTCFPVEVKTTFSTCTRFPKVPVNHKAVSLMMEGRMHQKALIVVVNSRTLEFWIFKANKSVRVIGETSESISRSIIEPIHEPLEMGRFSF